MRGLCALMRRCTGLNFLGRSGLPRINLGADFGGMFFGEKFVEWVLHKIRITQLKISIDIGVTHGFEHIVNTGRRVKAKISHRITFEDI